MSFTSFDLQQMQQRLAKNGAKADVVREDACLDESKLHEEIMAHCNNQWPKFKYLRQRMDKRSGLEAGAADFTVFLPQGRILIVEAKTKQGKLSTKQLGWQMQMEQLGHKVHVVRSLAEFVQLTKERIE